MARKQPSAAAPSPAVPLTPEQAESRDGVQVLVSAAAYVFWPKPVEGLANPAEPAIPEAPCELWVYLRAETWPCRAATGGPVVPRILRLVLPDGRSQCVQLPPLELG